VGSGRCLRCRCANGRRDMCKAAPSKLVYFRFQALLRATDPSYQYFGNTENASINLRTSEITYQVGTLPLAELSLLRSRKESGTGCYKPLNHVLIAGSHPSTGNIFTAHKHAASNPSGSSVFPPQHVALPSIEASTTGHQM
jgi:hypothetical protein